MGEWGCQPFIHDYARRYPPPDTRSIRCLHFHTRRAGWMDTIEGYRFPQLCQCHSIRLGWRKPPVAFILQGPILLLYPPRSRKQSHNRFCPVFIRRKEPMPVQ